MNPHLRHFLVSKGAAWHNVHMSAGKLREKAETEMMFSIDGNDVTFGMLPETGLGRLISLLKEKNYTVIAPTHQGDAIGLAEIHALDDLPVGLRDQQAPGKYRLSETASKARFAFSVGPQALKKYLHPPEQKLWQGTPLEDGTVRYEQTLPEATAYAFLGMRSCDLQAVAVLDRVFLDTSPRNESYAAQRQNNLFIAVDCALPAATCFCNSFDNGPDVRHHFDIALTEFADDKEVAYLARSGTALGAELLAHLAPAKAEKAHFERAHQQHEDAKATIGSPMETRGLKELLQAVPNHPQWDDVADRCLTCGNCTLVCPTCFCTTQETRTDLASAVEERWETWDSCFTLEFTEIGGGAVRQSPKSRYRQWMTHKLSTWVDQFDMMGCIGCGRCITWCPVGIDIRDEVAAIRTDAPVSDGDTP